jgi:hypothetical protein
MNAAAGTFLGLGALNVALYITLGYPDSIIGIIASALGFWLFYAPGGS